MHSDQDTGEFRKMRERCQCVSSHVTCTLNGAKIPTIELKIFCGTVTLWSTIFDSFRVFGTVCHDLSFPQLSCSHR